VDQYLNLRGRIGAERWVEQAQRLARGQSANLAGQNA
jgi:predicted flap endonuclease-1-like 5' DNA nuclease